jgi:hypothetical protein
MSSVHRRLAEGGALLISVSNLHEPLGIRDAIDLLQFEFNVGTLEVLVQDLDLLLDIALARMLEAEQNVVNKTFEKTYVRLPPSTDESLETTWKMIGIVALEKPGRRRPFRRAISCFILRSLPASL